jgi:hypothetical protein
MSHDHFRPMDRNLEASLLWPDLAGRTDVDINFLNVVEVAARERSIVAGRLVEHRNVRLDRALVDQPPQHLGGPVTKSALHRCMALRR